MKVPSLDRWWVRGGLLWLVYALLSLFVDPAGTLGTDSGAKVATLGAMVESDSFRPDLGYWAEAADPEGVYHPFLDTRPNDEGEWVQVTTLPMLVSAKPLADLGGTRLALVLPMLGAVLAALASALLAREVGSSAAARRAFWIVGLASPIAVYALDFWEHAPGAGLMLAGAAAMTRAVAGDRRWWPWLLAGAAFGLAGAMRSEAYIVAVVAVGLGAVWTVRHDVAATLRNGVAATAGFVAVFAANSWLESELGGNSRTDRATGRVSQGPFDRMGERVSDAAVTWFGGPAGDVAVSVMSGAAFVAVVIAAHAMVRAGRLDRSRVALGAGGILLLLLLASGPAFVPGALVASPVAIAVVAMREVSAARAFLLATALGSTFLIWAFQILGAAGPQWGGRYLLAPTMMLTVLGAVALDDVPPWLRRAHVGFAVAVTAFGLAWVSVRTHDVADFFDELVDRPESVLIASDGFLLREGGTAALDQQWLSLGYGEPFQVALDIAEQVGAVEVGLVSPVGHPPERDRWTATATTETRLLGSPYFVHTYGLDEVSSGS